MSDLITVEVTDGIQIITINRPEAKNAINLETAQAMAAALDQLDSRDDVRIGILTGGGGTFSSGMDLKAFAKSGQRPYVEGRGFAGLTERPPRKPLIAAVEGYALAGGCEMALASDLIVAANNAKFGLPEVKRGLVAGAGGMLRLPRRLPYHIAMEVILTGDMLPAERAHAFGLVNRLTEPGGALAGALELARAIVENGPLSVQTAKSIVSQSGDWSQDEMFDRQRPLTAHIFTSADAKEGATAFAEKRKPVWQGKWDMPHAALATRACCRGAFASGRPSGKNSAFPFPCSRSPRPRFHVFPLDSKFAMSVIIRKKTWSSRSPTGSSSSATTIRWTTSAIWPAPTSARKARRARRDGADPDQLAHVRRRQASAVPGHRHRQRVPEGRHGRALRHQAQPAGTL